MRLLGYFPQGPFDVLRSLRDAMRVVRLSRARVHVNNGLQCIAYVVVKFAECLRPSSFCADLQFVLRLQRDHQNTHKRTQQNVVYVRGLGTDAESIQHLVRDHVYREETCEARYDAS
jgi:hypothetical protein